LPCRSTETADMQTTPARGGAPATSNRHPARWRAAASGTNLGATLGATIAAALAIPGVAAAEPPRPIAPNPGTVDLPSPLMPRPLRTMMWEDVAPIALGSDVNSHTIYVHRCVGSDCTVAQGTTNSTAEPARSSLGHGVLSAFSQGDATWNTVME